MRPDSLPSLWRYINLLLTYLLTSAKFVVPTRTVRKDITLCLKNVILTFVTFAKKINERVSYFVKFTILKNFTVKCRKALSKNWSEMKHMIRSQAFVYFVVTVWEWILLTAAPTNWNFKFARTVEIFTTKFTNRWKKVNVNLTSTLTFTNVCYFSQ